MSPETFTLALASNQSIDFEDTIAVINEAGKNEGSCKIFYFAKLMQLDEISTLKCFGRFYQDVLNTPNGTDHMNIRNFMKDGWKGIAFAGQALTPNS